jgi:hypothetical protein
VAEATESGARARTEQEGEGQGHSDPADLRVRSLDQVPSRPDLSRLRLRGRP